MLGVARAGHGSSRKGLRMGETRGGEGDRLGNRRRGGKWSLRKGKDGIDHGEVIIFGF